MNEHNPEKIDWGLKPLHKKLLEALGDVHEFCNKHKIDYCLAYGSALGAERHHGFIPWDDDVDIYMTAESYKRFRYFFQLEGNHKKYYLQEIDSIDGMLTLAKLRINNTTYIESLYMNRDMHHGIYIDIFILHKAPSSKIKRRIMCFANQYLVLKGLSNRNYSKKKSIIPLLILLKLFPENFLRKQALKQLYKYDNNDSDTFFDNDLRTYSKSFYKQSIIFPTKIVEFEGIYLCVPGDNVRYLLWVYGDYMKLPTIEHIKKNQHAVIWDIEKDYHNYININ